VFVGDVGVDCDFAAVRDDWRGALIERATA
jgi:hypothetical protein